MECRARAFIYAAPNMNISTIKSLYQVATMYPADDIAKFSVSPGNYRRSEFPMIAAGSLADHQDTLTEYESPQQRSGFFGWVDEEV